MRCLRVGGTALQEMARCPTRDRRDSNRRWQDLVRRNHWGREQSLREARSFKGDEPFRPINRNAPSVRAVACGKGERLARNPTDREWRHPCGHAEVVKFKFETAHLAEGENGWCDPEGIRAIDRWKPLNDMVQV